MLFIIGIIIFLSKNDEIPLILPLFFLITGLFRYQKVQEGAANWVVVNYTLDIFNLNDKKAQIALQYFLLGTVFFLLSYLFFRYLSLPVNEVKEDKPHSFDLFLKKKTSFILILFVLFTITNTFMRGFVSGAASFGNSYFLQFQFAIGGLILLVFLVYQRVNFSESPALKIFFLLLLIYSIYISYNPTYRFQLLSWMIAIGVMVTTNKSAFSKLKYFAVGGFALLIVFALAGADRGKDFAQMSAVELYDVALERTINTEDLNMLDGFMMVLDVYPKHLDYHYGMEHMEILMRPIPRRLWPDKPVGGYANKLGLTDYENVGTVGISQTLYGSFYGEGGVLGIIIFSIVYGWLLAKLLSISDGYSSDVGGLIKGMVIASLIPFLRGGDLPGIVAWIGMTYWPVFLFLYLYKQSLKIETKEDMSPVHEMMITK